MIIQITRNPNLYNGNYVADVLELPGCPYVGIAPTPEEAVALVMLHNHTKLKIRTADKVEIVRKYED